MAVKKKKAKPGPKKKDKSLLRIQVWGYTQNYIVDAFGGKPKVTEFIERAVLKEGKRLLKLEAHEHTSL